MMELVITCWGCKGEIRGDRLKPHELTDRAIKLGWELGDRSSKNDPCTAKVCICPGCCEEHAEMAKIHNENLAAATEHGKIES
jgi:hypothetical protein